LEDPAAFLYEAVAEALVPAEPAPLAWAAAFGPNEIPRQVTLVDEAASERDFGNREIAPNSNSFARSMRRFIIHRCGDMPVVCRNA
jgi:hypothetical protein